MNLVRLRSMVGVCFLVALVGVIGSPEAVAAATCNTFDANNTPTTAFKGGEKIVVRGTGFAANSIVLVNLVQGNRTVELDRVRANDLGAFALTDATVPGSLSDGDAAIRALDARGSATCALTLTAGDGSEGGSLGGLFWVWGLVLALFGGVLAMLTYRRWKAERLREAVDSLAWRDQYEERSSEPERVKEAVAVGGRRTMDTSHVRGTDPLPSWTSDAMRPADEVRPSWVTDGPRPSWARPDDARGFDVGGMHEPRDEISQTSDVASDASNVHPADERLSNEPVSPWAPASPSSADDSSLRSWEPGFEPARAARDDADSDGASEPWQPGGGRIDEPLADEPAYRPVPQRPIPQRPVPGRPESSDVWALDDDDLSPIGAPRPFDDRFALDDDEPVGRGFEDARAHDPDEDPDPFRPPTIDEPFTLRSDPARPVPQRPVPQRPDPVALPDDDDGWDAAPVGAERMGAEPFAPRAPEPVDPGSVAAPVARESAATVPSTPLTPSAPQAPGAAGVQPERDFAAALRDFLDKQDMELDRRSGIADRPAGPRPGGGLLPQDAGRIPQAPAQPPAQPPAHFASPTPAQPSAPAIEPPAPRLGGVRPVAPRAPQPSVQPPVAPARPAVSEPADDPSEAAWRPAADPAAGRGLQPGPVPSAPAPETSSWELPDRPAPQTSPRELPDPPAGRVEPEIRVRRGAEVAPEAPLRTGAEPPPFDPAQRAAGSRAPERRDPEPALDLEAPARGWAPGAREAEGVSEPPVLPVGWDDGRLKPSARTEEPPARTEERPKRASDAIARLRREVRNWKR